MKDLSEEEFRKFHDPYSVTDEDIMHLLIIMLGVFIMAVFIGLRVYLGGR